MQVHNFVALSDVHIPISSFDAASIATILIARDVFILIFYGVVVGGGWRDFFFFFLVRALCMIVSILIINEFLPGKKKI